MNVWDAFKQRGDDWLAFLTLVGVAAQGQPDLVTPVVLKWIIFGTSVATIAHKVFFPTQREPALPKVLTVTKEVDPLIRALTPSRP